MRNTSSTRRTGRDSFPALLPGLYGRNHAFRPAFEGEDGDGAAGEGDAGGGEGVGEDIAEYTPDTKVRFPGMAKSMTVKEYLAHQESNYVPKKHVDGITKAVSQIAEAMKANKGGQPAPKVPAAGAGSATPAQRRDVIASLKGMEGVLTGPQMADVFAEIQDGTLGPMSKLLLAMGNRVQELTKLVGGTREKELDTEFGERVGRITKALKLPDVGTPIEGADVVRDLIRDRFYSYDDASQSKLTEEDFTKEVSAHFGQLRKFFRNLEKAELTAAQERSKKQFFARPGASSSSNGKGKPAFRSNRSKAAILFGGSEQST